jgi:hypothetical protein
MDTTKRTMKYNNLTRILVGFTSQRQYKETHRFMSKNKSIFLMREKVQETRDKVIATNFTIFTFSPLLLRGIGPPSLIEFDFLSFTVSS